MSPMLHLRVPVRLVQPPRGRFLGNELRGAFGQALRRLSCLTAAPSCEGCPVRRRCAYGVVFDPEAPPAPLHPSLRDGIPAYVVEPPPYAPRSVQEPIVFALTLLPPAIPHADLIERALRRAWGNHPRLCGGCQANGPIERTLLPPVRELPEETIGERLVLEFDTPLRVEQHGSVVADAKRLRPADLARLLVRRLQQWDQLSGERLSTLAADPSLWQAITIDARGLFPVDLHRYSRSQGRSHPLGGLLGPLEVHGPRDSLRALLPLLRHAERLHLGKRTAFGLGRFRLRWSG